LPNTASTGLPNDNIHVGASGGSLFLEGTISSFCAGAGIGFNHSAFNTNLRALLGV
jgi:hypothetical protein